MSPIKIVKSFYESDIANNPNVVADYFHKDAELHWTSSQGFRLLKYNDFLEFFEGTRNSYDNLRFEFTHLIESNSTVVTRHTLFGNTIELSDTEIVLGHFSTIWEVRDNKLFRGYEISQPADESDEQEMKSYS
ncbi:nuclear transport factor 2 family protein [Winogradskyella sp.]|uniref:nuclear transport factor 2 family protein n=1 Tax=Winogradskyella sp. TaxID=1883156 RepID=UPI003F6B3452